MSDSNRTSLSYAKEPSFAAPIGGAYATGAYTFSGVPANADTVTINGVVYAFKTGALVALRDVAAGASAAAAAANLTDAINANPQTDGVAFYTGTPANADVVATLNGSIVNVFARVHGTGGNSITTAESSAAITVGGATLAGGLASNYASVTGLRFNSESLKHDKVTVESQEIRADRTAFGLVKVGVGAAGNITHELHYGDLNGLICSAMLQPLSSGSDVASTWSIANSVLSRTGSPFSGELAKAKLVKISGFANAANNGIKRVLVSGSGLITLAGTTVNESAGPSVTVSWAHSRQGVTLESYLIEKGITDAGIYIPLTGMCVNTLALNLEARQKIMATFGFIGFGLPSGSSSRTDSVGTTVTAPSLNPIFNTTSHVIQLLVGGLPSKASVNSMTFNLNNNLRERLAIAREGTLVPGTGEASFTGTLKAYFDNKSMYDDYLQHVTQALEFEMVDSGGRVINVYLPAIQETDGSNDVAGLNQDVFLNLNFKAAKGVGHDGSQFQAQIDMLS